MEALSCLSVPGQLFAGDCPGRDVGLHHLNQTVTLCQCLNGNTFMPVQHWAGFLVLRCRHLCTRGQHSDSDTELGRQQRTGFVWLLPFAARLQLLSISLVGGLIVESVNVSKYQYNVMSYMCGHGRVDDLCSFAAELDLRLTDCEWVTQNEKYTTVANFGDYSQCWWVKPPDSFTQFYPG